MSIWKINGNEFSRTGEAPQTSKLPAKIFKVQASMAKGVYLEQVGDSFHFPYKILGVSTEFIERVTISFGNFKKNLGVLLSGLKGSGKSVDAKLIANNVMELYGVPCFLVDSPNSGFLHYINDIEQDLIIFIDEFEKVFRQDEDDADGMTHQEVLLGIMDGAQASPYKRLFILTTNTYDIDDYLIQRPSRVRYVKTYQELSRTVLEHIINTSLTFMPAKEELLNLSSQFNQLSMDMLKEVINECNQYNQIPSEFIHIMNISHPKKHTAYRFQAYVYENSSWVSIEEDLKVVLYPGEGFNAEKYDGFFSSLQGEGTLEMVCPVSANMAICKPDYPLLRDNKVLQSIIQPKINSIEDSANELLKNRYQEYCEAAEIKVDLKKFPTFRQLKKVASEMFRADTIISKHFPQFPDLADSYIKVSGTIDSELHKAMCVVVKLEQCGLYLQSQEQLLKLPHDIIEKSAKLKVAPKEESLVV